MATTNFPEKADGILLGWDLFPITRKTQLAVLETLSKFFFHDGSIVAVQNLVGMNIVMYSDARLLKSVEQSIMIQNDRLIIHTNDSRFTWKFDEYHSVEIWREQDVCSIVYSHYGEELTRTLFLRGAK